jgi:hypothetical protein
MDLRILKLVWVNQIVNPEMLSSLAMADRQEAIKQDYVLGGCFHGIGCLSDRNAVHRPLPTERCPAGIQQFKCVFGLTLIEAIF